MSGALRDPRWPACAGEREATPERLDPIADTTRAAAALGARADAVVCHGDLGAPVVAV